MSVYCPGTSICTHETCWSLTCWWQASSMCALPGHNDCSFALCGQYCWVCTSCCRIPIASAFCLLGGMCDAFVCLVYTPFRLQCSETLCGGVHDKRALAENDTGHCVVEVENRDYHDNQWEALNTWNRGCFNMCCTTHASWGLKYKQQQRNDRITSTCCPETCLKSGPMWKQSRRVASDGFRVVVGPIERVPDLVMQRDTVVNVVATK